MKFLKSCILYVGFQFLEAVFTAIVTSINIREYSKNLPVGQEIELDAKVVVELAQSKACF